MFRLQCVTVLILLLISHFYCSLIQVDAGALEYSGKSSHVLNKSEKELDKQNGNNRSDVYNNGVNFTFESKGK